MKHGYVACFDVGGEGLKTQTPLLIAPISLPCRSFDCLPTASHRRQSILTRRLNRLLKADIKARRLPRLEFFPSIRLCLPGLNINF